MGATRTKIYAEFVCLGPDLHGVEGFLQLPGPQATIRKAGAQNMKVPAKKSMHARHL